MSISQKHKKKPIRSFVRRSGRLTASQKRAIQTLWSKYVIETDTSKVKDLENFFDNPRNDLIMEIGFGNGSTLLESAINNPQKNFIGVEVYDSGFGQCLNDIEKQKINNVRLIYNDAVEVLKNSIKKKALAQVNIYFPDPWPKKRHHKRRLINNNFLLLLSKTMQDKGVINISTDWEDYADQIETVFFNNKRFCVIDSNLRMQKTKFENRGLALGHKIYNYSYQLD